MAQTPYDGLWNVTIVTKTGTCEPSASSTLTVTDGKISAPGADVSGTIGREGLVRVSIEVHMPMANSMVTPDRGNGMGHLREYRAAVAGKHRGSNASRMADT